MISRAGRVREVEKRVATGAVRSRYGWHRKSACSTVRLPRTAAFCDGVDILAVATLRQHWERVGPAIIAGLLTNLVARGQALFGSLYSTDGYFVAKKSFADEIAYNLGDGRFLRALLWRLQGLLGFSPVASESASLALATVALVAAAIYFAEAIFRELARDAIVLFALLFTLHPS
jgi:hypothetical protein